MTAETDAGTGAMRIGGVDLDDVVHTFGTPVLVYDEAHLRERCRALRRAFPDGVSYASKAFLCLAMAALVVEEGLHVDVSSSGELAVVVAAGVPGDRIVMHGNNKSADDLRAALRAGVGRLVLDSFDELDRLGRLLHHAKDGGAPALLVRINPAITPHTHAHVCTGQAASKFGFRVDTGDADRVIARISADKRFRLAGVHVHVGSQLVDMIDIASGAQAAAALAARHHLGEVSVGGGLAVASTRDQGVPSVNEWAESVRVATSQAGFTGRVVAEPGRSLVASAAVTLYRVGTLKPLPDDAQVGLIAAVDGGLSDNPRPALYGAAYEALRLSTPSHSGPWLRTRVVGKNCESGDTLIDDIALPGDLSVDDVLVVPVTGAYTYAMASNYNKLPRPAVVFVRDGHTRLVVRRETEADLYRLDEHDRQGDS